MRLAPSRSAEMFACVLAALAASSGQCSKAKTALERFLGKQTVSVLRDQYGVCRSRTLNRWVGRLGQRLVEHAPRHDVRWEFAVLDTDEINALAAPGGFVFVTKGLLHTARSEDEIAAVLGHEAGHVVESHSLKQAFQQGGMALVLKAFEDDRHREAVTALLAAEVLLAFRFSRQDELAADQWGLRLTAEAGYDPKGMLRFLDTLKWLEGKPPKRWEVLLATHPPEASRRRAAQDSPWLRDAEGAPSLQRARTLEARHRWSAALAAYRDAAATEGEASAASARLEERLELAPPVSVEPLPESLATEWGNVRRQEDAWKPAAEKRRRQMVAHVREAFRRRKETDPLHRVVFARANPEDVAWLHVAWRVAFLRQKIADTLMRCGRISRESRGVLERFQDARLSVTRGGAVESLVGDGVAPLTRQRSERLRFEVDTAVTLAESSGRLAVRAVRDLVPPLLALLDPSRARSQRLVRGRLLAAQTTLIHAELETQRAWVRARDASRHLDAAGVLAESARICAVEVSGELPPDRCRDLAAYELCCSTDDLRSDDTPGQSLAQAVEHAFPRLEGIEASSSRTEAPRPWIRADSPVDLAAAWVLLRSVHTAMREEIEAAR